MNNIQPVTGGGGWSELQEHKWLVSVRDGSKISQREIDDTTLMCQLQKADRRLCSRNTGNEAQVFASLY